LDSSSGNQSDGLRNTGFSNVSAEHNTFLKYGGNTCIRIGAKDGNASDASVDDNLFDGTATSSRCSEPELG
jgi:hypothetical protein